MRGGISYEEMMTGMEGKKKENDFRRGRERRRRGRRERVRERLVALEEILAGWRYARDTEFESV